MGEGFFIFVGNVWINSTCYQTGHTPTDLTFFSLDGLFLVAGLSRVCVIHKTRPLYDNCFHNGNRNLRKSSTYW